MKKILLILALCLLLCGCGNKITYGEVYDKEFRAAHSTVRVIPITRYNGKTHRVRMIPFIHRYPDRYVIFIKAFNEEDGKWITEDYYVSKDLYEHINIGDMFEYDESRGDLDDEPYTKERE